MEKKYIDLLQCKVKLLLPFILQHTWGGGGQSGGSALSISMTSSPSSLSKAAAARGPRVEPEAPAAIATVADLLKIKRDADMNAAFNYKFNHFFIFFSTSHGEVRRLRRRRRFRGPRRDREFRASSPFRTRPQKILSVGSFCCCRTVTNLGGLTKNRGFA
jgi:hypothetical protein